MLAAQLDSEAELSALDRLQLNGMAADAGVLVEQVTRTLSGVDLEGELARLLDQVDL